MSTGSLLDLDFYEHFLNFRCGPCKMIAPLFNQLPSKYPKAIFLKVDVDKCQETAAMQGT